MGTHSAGHSPGRHHSGEEGLACTSGGVGVLGGIIQDRPLDPWPPNHTNAWLVSDQLVLFPEAHQGGPRYGLQPLRVEGIERDHVCPGHVMHPCCLHQVSVNPAYQAPELEYALKKVSLFLGWGRWGRLVSGAGGFQLSQRAGEVEACPNG